jgi:carboxyl-terminal processing protease
MGRLTSLSLGRITAALAVFGVALTGPAPSDAQPRPVHASGSTRPANPLIGVWREIGYGRMLSIGEAGFDQYHETSILCYRDPNEVNARLDSRYALFDLSENGTTLTLYFHDLGRATTQFQNHQRFERIPSLPERCVPSLAGEPYERPSFIFDLFWQTFAEHYAFFAERNLDWRRMREQFRPRVRADMPADELFGVFSEMLGSLNDGHVNLYLGPGRRFNAGRNSLLPLLRRSFDLQKPPQDFGAFVSGWARGLKDAASTFVGGRIRKAANDTIWWGDVDEQIGYINIYQLTNFVENATWSNRAHQLEVVDGAFDEIFAAFRDKRAILLDLTHNQGGFDAASDLIASRFADRARHALTVQPFGTDESKAERITVVPSARTRFTKPVFVMTSEVTVSAGEGLVAMLSVFPHVTHIGQPTRGYLSGILNKPLPASFSVSVTSQVIRTPEGIAYEARGIPPEIPVDVFPPDDIFGGYPKALRTAAALIRTRLSQTPGAER